MVYFYYISKYIDLLDTVFFVLRKKWRNISGLHLFHHSLMPIGGYFFAKNLGHDLFTPLGVVPQLNSFVHIPMYYYYAMMALGNKSVLKWKKYVTVLQLVQFSILVVHSLYFMFFAPSCAWPKVWPTIYLFHAFLFLYLFGSFYVKNYITDRNNNTKKVE
jgi:elongation of very long chain fatty acids protein 4